MRISGCFSSGFFFFYLRKNDINPVNVIKDGHPAWWLTNVTDSETLPIVRNIDRRVNIDIAHRYGTYDGRHAVAVAYKTAGADPDTFYTGAFTVFFVKKKKKVFL